MKQLLKYLVIIVIFLQISSCKKDADKGGLTITVTMTGTSSIVQGAFVGIAISQEDINNSYFLDYKLSEANGEANFTDLKPDDYYYKSYYQVGSTQYFKEGQVKIVEGKHVDLTIALQ